MHSAVIKSLCVCVSAFLLLFSIPHYNLHNHGNSNRSEVSSAEIRPSS